VIAQETVNGTAWLLRQIERSLFFGDSSCIPVQWDGLVKQIEAGAPNPTLNVVDMQDKPLSEDAINDGALIIKSEPNYGRATDLYCADGAYSDLAKSFYPGQMYPTPPGGWTGGMVGMNIKGFYSQFGPIKFNPDVFVQFGPVAPTSAVGNTSKRPSTPTESSPPSNTGSDGHFGTTYAGAHYYKICAVNRYGRSAPLSMTGPVTVGAAEHVTMTVGDGSTTGTCFEAYRTHLPGEALGTEKYVETFARTGVTTTWVDYNHNIPGTSKALLIQQNLEFFSFKQLAPFMKIPLATVDLSIRWVQALYGAPTVYVPGRGVIFKNIGRAPGSAGVNNAVA
jgi:hypothetical protein